MTSVEPTVLLGGAHTIFMIPEFQPRTDIWRVEVRVDSRYVTTTADDEVRQRGWERTARTLQVRLKTRGVDEDEFEVEDLKVAMMEAVIRLHEKDAPDHVAHLLIDWQRPPSARELHPMPGELEHSRAWMKQYLLGRIEDLVRAGDAQDLDRLLQILVDVQEGARHPAGVLDWLWERAQGRGELERLSRLMLTSRHQRVREYALRNVERMRPRTQPASYRPGTSPT